MSVDPRAVTAVIALALAGSACAPAPAGSQAEAPGPTTASTPAPTPTPSPAPTRADAPAPAPALADAPRRAATRPPIHWDPIPYDARRKRDMRAYSRRHYGLDRAGLKKARVVVQHVAVASSYGAVRNTFAPNTVDPELGEKPNVCSHFVVDGRGTIHQLVPLRLMCRHTVGLNHVAIGIEHTGFDDGDVLGNVRQLRASLRLTAWLRAREGIALGDVIGHNESLSSPYHRERVTRLRKQTHGDFRASSMRTYRARLAELERDG